MGSSKRKRRRSFSIPRIWQYIGVGALVIVTGAMVWQASQPVTAPVSATEREALTVDDFRADESGEPFYVRPADRPLEVVFAGDSLTYGLFASTEAAGYRPQVVAWLEQGGPVTATRGGQSGNQVATVTESITFPPTTDIAVLALGTNDQWKTPVPEFTAQYQALVDKVRASAPDAALVCLGIWSNVDAVRNWDAPIKDICGAAGGRYVPLGDLNDDPANHGPAGREAFGGTGDEMHPNDTGYAAIAARVIEALNP